MKALEKDRTRRYETASSLARDVERYLADEPVEACPPSAAYRFRKFARKHRSGPDDRGRVRRVARYRAWWHARSSCCGPWPRSDTPSRGEEGQPGARQGHPRREARRRGETALVMAMNNFLRHELLEQADPAVHANLDQKPDKDIKLRTVLDRAAGRIAGAFPDRPELEAAIRRSIGEAYRGLGELRPGPAASRGSLPGIFRKSLGDNHPDTLTTQENLANLFRDLGELDHAEPMLQDALEARRRTLGPDHPDTLSLQHNLADLYWSWRKHSKAEPTVPSDPGGPSADPGRRPRRHARDPDGTGKLVPAPG